VCPPVQLPDGTEIINPDHVIYKDDNNCTCYFECNMGITCKNACNEGLGYDIEQQTCVLPAQLDYACLDRNNIGHKEEVRHATFENAHYVNDPSNMNAPLCSHDVSVCMISFRAIYGRAGVWNDRQSCTNEFEVCQNGWTCKMRCDEGYRLDVSKQKCVPKEFVKC